MGPQQDTVVALTLDDGCSADTQMSVEYLMVFALILQNLMVAPAYPSAANRRYGSDIRVP